MTASTLPAVPGLHLVPTPDFDREQWTTTGAHRIELGDIVSPFDDLTPTVITEIDRRSLGDGPEYFLFRGYDLTGFTPCPVVFNAGLNDSLQVRCDLRYTLAQEPRECRTCGEPADAAGRIEHRPGTPCTTDYRAI